MFVSGLSADYFINQRIKDPSLFWFIAVVSISMSILLTLPSYWSSIRMRAYQFSFGTLLVNGVLLICAGVQAWIDGNPFPTGWIMVLIFYTFVLTGLPYRYCTPLGLGLGAFSIGSTFALGAPVGHLVDHCLLIISVTVTGMVACSTLERIDRQGWLRALRMQVQSYSDPLTGLLNRRYFFEEGARQINSADPSDLPIAMLMLDIDYFKKYNDHLGHPQGDRCLRKVASAANPQLRHPLDINARLGGEEFAVLLFSCDQEHALVAAEAIRESVAALDIEHPGSPLGRVSISVGVSVTNETDQSNLDTLLLAADRALYRAKNGGRNRVSL